MSAGGRSGAPPRVLFVEGIIGAGKSSLCQSLARYMGCVGHVVEVVPEPVDRWVESGALKQFYADPVANAYKFQTYAYSTRVRTINAAYRGCDPHVDLLIVERSPLSDRIFMQIQKIQGNVSATDMRMYESWCDLHDLVLPFRAEDASYLYLDTTVSECVRRQGERGREAEGAIPADYQRLLKEGHDHLLGGGASERFANLPRLARVARVPESLANADFRDEVVEIGKIVAELLGRK